MRWWLILLVPLAGCVSEAPEPSVEPMPEAVVWPTLGSPMDAGPAAAVIQDYDLGSVVVGGPDAAHSEYEYDARIRGTLALPDAPGPFPLAVFLHGQHNPCSDGTGQTEGGDCDVPYRNDRGYVYLQEFLASHGIASASILAHEINLRNGAGDVGMWARGELVLATVDALATSEWAARLDLTRLAFMGHSRGGEGVVTAVEVNQHRAAPRPIAGVLPLAPTDFAHRNATGIPFMTLLPYCDGDVYSLHGARTYDQSLLRDDASAKIQVLVMGANHNNYNTMWGKPPSDIGLRQGDDAPIGRHTQEHCDLDRDMGGGRLSLDDTYQEAILHMGSFLRWVLLDDPRMRAFLVDDRHDPQEACPAGTDDCFAEWLLSAKPAGARVLVASDADGLASRPGTALVTEGLEQTPCTGSRCASNLYGTGHYTRLAWTDEGSIRIDPSEDGGTLHIRLAIDTRPNAVAVRGAPTAAKRASWLRCGAGRGLDQATLGPGRGGRCRRRSAARPHRRPWASR